MSARTMREGQKCMLLDRVMSMVTPEQRRVLMRELPVAYNEFCDRPVVMVVRIHDGTEVTTL